MGQPNPFVVHESSTSARNKDHHQYPQHLRVVSYNCWGLKLLAKYRRERLREIGAQLASSSPRPDIVGLQECWTQQDYHSIHRQTEHFLPYAKFYYSGIFGGGLAILSKWPIEESNMVRYPLNGRPTAFFRGDWFVGKGVACATIRLGPEVGDVAEVFCTHLHAPYEVEPHDSYICHRTAQAWEIAKLMRGASERGHLVIGLGDFNMIPLSLAHRIIETRAPVRDVWRVVHPDSSIGAAVNTLEMRRGKPMPTIECNLTKNGTTCDSALNSWRWDKSRRKQLEKGQLINVELNSVDPHGKRLDYIFFGDGRQTSQQRTWHVDSVNVGMTDTHPTLRCSLSDHFSVEASFSCHETADRGNVAANGHALSGDAREIAENTGAGHLTPEAFDEILTMLYSYNARERRQRRLRLAHFSASVIISVGCLTAVWWSPNNYASFLLMLISSLGLSSGVIDGLIGGLFIGSEIRALKEFEWEIRNAMDRAAEARGSQEDDVLWRR